MSQSAGSLLQAACSRLFVQGNAKAIKEVFTADYVVHITGQDIRDGRGAVRSVVELYRKAFTELSVDVVVLLESSEFVAWQRTIRATHSGAFKGFPGTSQPIVWREMVVSRFVGKLIGEEWVVSDLAERLLLARKAIARNGPSNAKPKKSRAETDA